MTDFKELRIIFMGTPEFAVASLDALIKAGAKIVAVVTVPDKASGRGMHLSQSAVKKYAVQNNVPLLQPEKLKNEVFLQQLRELNADLQIVVAFRMLPELVWNMPPMGTINLHGSLLPQYRGAAPINWAVINGETETGVTTFKLQHLIDTGNILLQEKIPIQESDTAGTVHDKMKETGAALLVKTIKDLCAGQLHEEPQTTLSKAALKNAPKIFTETCKIDFSKAVEEVYNQIRGLSPFPTAFTHFNGKLLKVFFAQKEILAHQHPAGDFITDGKTFLKFACKDGFIHVTDIQPEGKKRMRIEDFLRGYRSHS